MWRSSEGLVFPDGPSFGLQCGHCGRRACRYGIADAEQRVLETRVVLSDQHNFARVGSTHVCVACRIRTPRWYLLAGGSPPYPSFEAYLVGVGGAERITDRVANAPTSEAVALIFFALVYGYELLEAQGWKALLYGLAEGNLAEWSQRPGAVMPAIHNA